MSIANGTVNLRTGAWELIEHEVICVECERRQHLSECETGFKHLPGVEMIRFSR